MFHKEVILNNNFPVLQIEFDKDDIELAKRQAELKAKYTSDADQNGDVRKTYTKICKQLSGCLSEIAVDYYLRLISIAKAYDNKLVRIIRYDDIRIDGYRSPENEFDIRILSINPNEKFDVSVRSSINFKRDLRGITNLNIIGPYTNKVKLKETPSDFYIQPIFQYKKPDEDLKVQDLDFCKLFDEGLFDLYIVGGCTKNMMEQSDKFSSLGQKDTNYRILGIGKGSNHKALGEQIHNQINNWFYNQSSVNIPVESITEIQTSQTQYKCEDCSSNISSGIHNFSVNNYNGRELCMDCQKKYK